MTESSKLLGIYLNDHYAGANGGVALARRIAKAHSDTTFGPQLAELKDDIVSDRAALIEVMEQLGFGVQRWRAGFAIAANIGGWLKLNGRLLSRSPLSNVLELEALLMGVNGKRSAWLSLRRVAESDGRLDAGAIGKFLERSYAQTELLERVHAWAREQAFLG